MGAASKLESGIVFVSISGDLKPEELLAFCQENIDSWVGKPALWDLEGFNFSREYLQQAPYLIRETVKIFNRRTGEKSAVLAKSKVLYGTARMYQQMRDGVGAVQLRVFDDRERAINWLQAPG